MNLNVDMTQRGKITISLSFSSFILRSIQFLLIGLFFLYGLLFRFRGQISGGLWDWKRVMQLRSRRQYFRVIFGGEEAPPFVLPCVAVQRAHVPDSSE